MELNFDIVMPCWKLWGTILCAEEVVNGDGADDEEGQVGQTVVSAADNGILIHAESGHAIVGGTSQVIGLLLQSSHVSFLSLSFSVCVWLNSGHQRLQNSAARLVLPHRCWRHCTSCLFGCVLSTNCVWSVTILFLPYFSLFKFLIFWQHIHLNAFNINNFSSS